MTLKELTELNGVSGFEDEVREYIRSEISCYADEIKTDSIGNLFAYKKGTSPGYRIMLSAHMDEVGFMVTGYGEGGMLKFRPVGGIDSRILPGKRVLVGQNRIPGVIGIKPIHLQEKDERKNNIKLKSMYIDIGCDKREEAEKLAPLGEPIAFHSEYIELGGSCIKAKALDDRTGCAVLMEMLKNTYSFDLQACFTVQEEVGLRGAETAAYRTAPDLALVIEGTTCSDVPEIEEQDYSSILGAGAVLTIMDRTAYADKKLVEFIGKVAKERKIAFQYKKTTTGGNDASKIQLSRGGVRVASISTPCRYIHSPVSVMSMEDFECVKRLTAAVLEELSGNRDAIKTLLEGEK